MSTGTWEWDEADPDVGIFTSSLVHTCEGNEEAESAVETDVRFWNAPGNKTVKQQTTWTCPVDGATTTAVEEWPAWMFEEPRP